MDGLKEKTVKGVSWSLAEQFGLQGLRLVTGLILARILTPDDFGLVGMAGVFFAIGQVFIDGGFSISYIQKKEVSEADANTVFYTNLFVSILVYGLFWVFAPAISRFYNQPQLVDLTRVLSLVLIINSFNIIQVAMLTREVDFKRKTRISLASTLGSGVLGILAALKGYGVWSLVIQQIAGRLFTTLGFWITTRWRPGLIFSGDSFRRMFSFGAWALASNLLRTLFDNIYTLTIGRMFPVAQVGYYTKAQQFQLLASQNLVSAIGAVSFPVLSRLQGDLTQLTQAMKKFMRSSLFFIIPLMTALLITARPFTLIFLTEKWEPMVPLLRLLCLVGILYPIHMVNVQALTASGRIRQGFTAELIKNGLRISNIIIMSRYSVIHIVAGEVMVSTLSLFVNTGYTRKYVGYGLLRQLRDMWELIAGGIAAAMAGYLAYRIAPSLWLSLISGVITVPTVFFLFQYLFNRSLFNELWGFRKLYKGIK